MDDRPYKPRGRLRSNLLVLLLLAAIAVTLLQLSPATRETLRPWIPGLRYKEPIQPPPSLER